MLKEFLHNPEPDMKAVYKILHLEDTVSDAQMIDRVLRKHRVPFESRVVDTKKDFIAALKNYSPDVILSDHTLPAFNSVEALNIVHNKGMNIPFILVTSPISEEFAVDVIKQGADDYVLKDRLQRLPSAMLNALKKKHYQNEQKRLLKELKIEQEMARETLRKLSDRMVLAARAASVGVWEWDVQKDNLEWDKTMHSLHGMDPECFEGGFQAWENCMHPDDILRVREEMYKALTGEKEFDTEFRVKWSDGSIHYIKAVGLVQRTEEGIAERMLGTNWDVTERRNLEDELQRSEDFYRALIESSTELKCLTAADGTITYVSPSVTAITGFTARQMLGKKHQDFVHPADRDLLQAHLLLLKQSAGSSARMEFRCINKAGHYRWFEGNVINLLDTPGVASLIFTSWDITDRKKAEEQMERQNNELTKANAELDNFVYSASHELRAPLCSLMGLINLLDDEQNAGEKQSILSMMQKSVNTLDGFIKDIVHYSRNSRLDIEHEQINFNELIKESKEQFHYLENASAIDIISEVHSEADFFSDRKRITIIINNLLSNAITYHDTLKSNPYIHIRVRINEEAAYMEFCDNGTGIGSKHHDKIFDMFYRASNKKSGAGLGLYIVREILDKLSGSVTVSSKAGAGTTFFVTIPNSGPPVPA